MALDSQQITNIEQTVKNSLRRRFQNYSPEPAAMPFHTRLLGSDRLALYAFIHSLNTNFGTTIFEPVAKEIAGSRFISAELQRVAGRLISSDAQSVIQNIMDDLITARALPNKAREIEMIRAVCQSGEMREAKPTKVDIKLINNEGSVFLIDLKTAKPNAGGFKEFKRTLLEWVAVTLCENPDIQVDTLIAIPYNPYEPQPYGRWTMRGMIDLNRELKVATEFWDFLGGDGTYEVLLDAFQRVGVELSDEIDEYFSRF